MLLCETLAPNLMKVRKNLAPNSTKASQNFQTCSESKRIVPELTRNRSLLGRKATKLKSQNKAKGQHAALRDSIAVLTEQIQTSLGSSVVFKTCFGRQLDVYSPGPA